MSALLAESSRAHSVLSLLSFYEYSDPLWDFVLLLPQMENEMDALLAILLLKPLLEYSWVFSNPVKVPSVGPLLTSRTQRVLSSAVPACTLSLRPPGGVSSFHRTFSSFVLLYPVPLCTCSNAQLAELSESQ
jgi:hypothetical protein